MDWLPTILAEVSNYFFSCTAVNCHYFYYNRTDWFYFKFVLQVVAPTAGLATTTWANALPEAVPLTLAFARRTPPANVRTIYTRGSNMVTHTKLSLY